MNLQAMTGLDLLWCQQSLTAANESLANVQALFDTIKERPGEYGPYGRAVLHRLEYAKARVELAQIFVDQAQNALNHETD